jgi:hypothetical protein
MKKSVGNNGRAEARPKLDVPNMAIHTVYGCKNMVSYGTEPYHILYRQRSTKSFDSTGAMAVIRHCTTIDVWHGAQPYVSY